MLAVEGIVDLLTETGANCRLIAIANGFEQHVLEAVALKYFAKDVKHLSLKCLTHYAKFFEQAK